MLTQKDIETAIDTAITKAKAHTGTRDDLIKEVIEPLQKTLKTGIKQKMNCNEKTLRTKFAKLEKVLLKF